jgi:hypothetical protein
VVPRHRRRDPRTGKVEDVETYTYQRRGGGSRFSTPEAGSSGGGRFGVSGVGPRFSKRPPGRFCPPERIAGRFNVPKDRDVVGERHAAELKKRQTPQIVGKSKVPKIGSGMTEKQQQYQRIQRLRPSSRVGAGPAAKGGPNYKDRRDAVRAKPTAAPPGSQRAKVEQLGQARQVPSVGQSLAKVQTKLVDIPPVVPPQFALQPFGPDRKPTMLMTPASHQHHLDRVDALLQNAQKQGLDTSQMYTRPVLDADGKQKVDPDGNPIREYTPERDAQHQKIIADALAAAEAAGVPKDHQAIMSGGLGGAGKTTVLESRESGIDTSKYITLNPDDMKEELIRRGMVPEISGVQPMEASVLIHEESAHLAKLLAEAAGEKGYNVIWDISMAKDSQVEKRLAPLDSFGYKTRAVFVSIPLEESVSRALNRHNLGATQYLLQNKGVGGRYFNPTLIRKSATETPGGHQQVFLNQRDRFSDWQIFDNSGDGSPVLIGSKDKGLSPQVDPAARGLPTGTIRLWNGDRYQKQANGQWRRITGHGHTVGTSAGEIALDKVVRLTGHGHTVGTSAGEIALDKVIRLTADSLPT